MTPPDARREPHWTGSFVSAFAGWLTFLLVARLCSDPSSDNPDFVSFYAVILGIVTFFVWVFVLLPLYVAVPADSPLWRWPLCTLCGTAAGTLIGCAFFLILDPASLFKQPLGIIGACLFLGGLIGGATCLFGSLTLPLFRWWEPARLGAALLPSVRRSTGLRVQPFARWWLGPLIWFRRQVRRGRARFLELAGQ